MREPSNLAYLHPVLAAGALAAAAWAASLGIRGRRRRGTDLERHARLAPFAWMLMLLTWAGGLLSVVLWREDLDFAASAHFRLGTAITLLFTLSAASRRWMDVQWVRAIHPWLGGTALLLCGFQVFLGLGMMP